MSDEKEYTEEQEKADDQLSPNYVNSDKYLPIDDETDASEAAMAAKSGNPYPNYVDLDSDVKVKSGINVAEDVDNRDEVLRAATMFMKHPARALSCRELGILMTNKENDYNQAPELGTFDAAGYIKILVEAGFLKETNEVDDCYTRYRVM